MLFQKRVCEHTKLDFYISFNTILFSIFEEEKNPTNLQNSQILGWYTANRLYFEKLLVSMATNQEEGK